MQINLTNAGKRFNREWIFRHVDFNFLPGNAYAITGSNGSGKSTLLQVIAGAIMQSEGSIIFNSGENKNTIAEHLAYKQIAVAAPYLELIEEFSATEFLEFHANFKLLTKSIPEILEEVGLIAAAHKQIRYYSSGMKQRLKLAQAFFSNTSVLLLDEPTTNLDAVGIKLYQQLISNCSREKLILVSSNDKIEYDFCNEVIAIEHYK